jgi:AcrR family transcriptional regulator
MRQEDPARRRAILQTAGRILVADPAAPVSAVCTGAGVSRATFYRYFPSRAALLEALDVEPDPGTRERILAAAIELLERDGLARLSMDDVADRAGVSRASVYRLYPGKSALFAALLAAESPFAEVSATLHRLHDRPPREVLPLVLRILDRVLTPRIGVLRALMLEVSVGTPEAVEAAEAALRPMFGEVSAYFAGQMDAGTVRRMHPLLAGQALVGPFLLHLVGRPFVAPIAHPEVDTARAAEEFARVALRGLAPDPTEE